MKRQALMAALALGAIAAPVPGHAQMAQQRPTIVLVHGGFVDGSGWQGVYKLLRKDGFTVRGAQNPTISLAGDVPATRPSWASTMSRVAATSPASEIVGFWTTRTSRK